MAFSVGGLASGLDTKSIISQLMNIEARPKTKLEWKSQLDASRKTIWRDLNSRLNALQTSANLLMNPTTWDVSALPPTGSGIFAATTSNAGIASGTVTGTPTAGTYAVDVLQLSRAEVSMSTGSLLPLGVDVAGDTLTIGQGASSWNVALAGGDQVQDIVNKINGTAGIGVFATLVGSDIRLQSTSIGAASAFTVSSAGTTAGLLSFSETQTAQDSLYTVDGAPFSSATNNNAAGAITGLSLNLAAVGSTNITVAETSTSGQSPQEDWIDATKAKIKTFVDQYNSVLDLVHQKTQGESRVINPKTLGDYLAGPMARSYEMSKYSFDLRQVVSESVTGFAPGQDTLASIGISSIFDPASPGQNGKLKIDDVKLEAALRTDAVRVQGVLGQSGAGAGITNDDGFARRISEMVTTTDTMLDSKDAALSTQATRLQKSIQNQETRLELRRKAYERMYASMETMMGKLQTQGNWLSGQLQSLSGGQQN